MTHSVRAMARPAAAVTCAAAALALLSGCSLFTGSDSRPTYSGGVVPAGDARSGQLAGATASPGASGTAAPAASASSTPYIEAVAKGACKPQVFVDNAALAGGAIDGYIAKPLQAAAPSVAVTGRAAQAATYAATTLTQGAKALQACPTAKSLASISTQSAAALTKLSTSLKKGSAPQNEVQAVSALFADVVAQAARLRLTVTTKTPGPEQLTP